MRVFSTDSVWDVEEQQWYEAFFVNKEEVTSEEYFRELETEQCLENDEVEDEQEYCKCCSCDAEDCESFECTCDVNEELEDDNCEPCQCVECKSARGEFTAEEEYEIGLVEHYAGYIEDIECECGSELRNVLYSMLQECMSMGYENAKDELDEKTVNISIDNLTINANNAEDLVFQLKNISKLRGI